MFAVWWSNIRKLQKIEHSDWWNFECRELIKLVFLGPFYFPVDSTPICPCNPGGESRLKSLLLTVADWLRQWLDEEFRGTDWGAYPIGWENPGVRWLWSSSDWLRQWLTEVVRIGVPLIGWNNDWLRWSGLGILWLVETMTGWGVPDWSELIGWYNDWLRTSWLESVDWIKFHCMCYYVESRLDGRRPVNSTCYCWQYWDFDTRLRVDS